jgi:hypothetical protein
VLWTNCGAFRLARDGTIARLPRRWLAHHGSGTGRRYEPDLDIRRTRAGAFLLLREGRVVWRSSGLYPRDGGGVAFGPDAFAFASYRHGIYLTDLHGPERLVLAGRGLYPYTFTGSSDLIVTGSRTITVLSPSGAVLRRFAYRPRNGFGFDEQTETLYYVTPAGRLAVAHGTHVALNRSVARIDGLVSVERADLLVYSGGRSITVTTRDGAVIAGAHWNARLHSDGGVAVSANGRDFAFRLSDAHAGSRSGSATVYLLKAGATRAEPLYLHRLGPSGCAVGAGFSWRGSSLLYSSSDGTLALLDADRRAGVNLTRLAARLPHRSAGERALAAWRSDFPR